MKLIQTTMKVSTKVYSEMQNVGRKINLCKF